MTPTSPLFARSYPQQGASGAKLFGVDIGAGTRASLFTTTKAQPTIPVQIIRPQAIKVVSQVPAQFKFSRCLIYLQDFLF